MNEIQINNFDYSILDASTAEYLKDRENSMSKTLEHTAEKLGEDLYKAQQKLAKNGYGQFEEWYTSLGFKKRSVYNYIDRYSFVQQLHNQNDIETFQELPARMQNEMSKRSADTEINQMVFDGDIKTHKEYKEMEREKKEAQRQLEMQERANKELQSKLEEAEKKPVEVIEKYMEPDDYENLKYSVKRQEEILQGREKYVQQLEKEIADMRAKRSDMDKKSKQYDELNNAINEMNGKLSRGQKRIAAQKEVYDLISNSNRLIEEIAPLSYLVHAEEVLDNEYAVNRIKKVIKSLNDISKRLNDAIQNSEIVEVN